MSYTEILASEESKQSNVIYKITNLFNDKVYIGQTKKSLRDRLAQHIWQMKNDSTYFHRALVKYGISNFDITIIDKCDDEKFLDGLEIYWISYYNSTNHEKGYNITSGGSGKRSKRPNYKHKDTIQTRNKKSSSAKQKWKDANYRARYKSSRSEYKKVVQLDEFNRLIKIFPSITDAEIYIKGRKTGIIWSNLCNKNKPEITINNYKWMLYDKYLQKYRKVEDELSLHERAFMLN